METYEARLESFGTAKAAAKKGTAATKGIRDPSWPHSEPSPARLARTGFYWDPNEVSEDRVACCLCQTVLDGWEVNDDPIKEHINYSPDCGIAIQANIEQDIEAGKTIDVDPNSEDMVNARKATFRDLWPHERKRGWTCKTQKLAEAGWYYCPTNESDDFVKCAYCSLSLDGWEPKDKPYEEHQRRSANCLIFNFGEPAKPKAAKPKKSRASKASRLSTQSTATAMDDTAMVDATINDGDTVLTTVTETTQTSTPKKRKGGRPKKGKSKSKAAAAPVAESAPASSMLEPEDDDFEVKVTTELPKSTRTLKRKSDEMEPEEEVPEAPPPKRRGTRAHSSTLQPEQDVAPEGDAPMANADADADADNAPVKAAPKAKRATRGRAASTRKASSKSTRKVSTAKVAGKPADEEIDAALEADLDRPLTDDEISLPSKPVARSRNASRAQTKKEAAPAPLPPKEGRESTVSTATMQTAQEDMSSMINPDDATFAAPIKNPKQRNNRKINVPLESTLVTSEEGSQQTSAFQEETSASGAPTRGKGRLPSRKASRQISRQQAKAGPENIEVVPIATEVVSADITMIHAPAEDEVEAATPKAKRGKKTALGKKSKMSKAETTEEPIEEIFQAAEDAVEGLVEKELEELPKSKPGRGRPKKVKPSTEIKSAPAPEPPSDNIEITELPSPAVRAAAIIESEVVEVAQTASSTPVKTQAPAASKQVPSPTPSPQSSNAENQPPSSRPTNKRPPLAAIPSSPVTSRIPLAASTPTAARSNINPLKLSTSFPWTSVDLEYALAGTPGAAEQENLNLWPNVKDGISSPEKCMTVEQWIRHQAILGQERLKGDCERVVQRFENEGVRALKALEGIEAAE